ncbi:MAG: hypothetical protein H6709_07500 [Kofleriaceae bacterium]|nr:hypothetical protein [Kofleriaceae bacterium]
MSITGQVVEARGRWTADRRTIVTDAVIVGDDGARTTVTQLGGRADGFGMQLIPGPARLEVGDRVLVRARAATTRRGRPRIVADDVTVLAGGATPFVRTGPTPAGHYLYWRSGCVFLTYDVDGTVDLAGDSERAVMDQVLATWNAAIEGCSYLQLLATAPAQGEVGHDDVNLITFRDDTWCRPATDGEPPFCLPVRAAALTTVVFVDDASSPRDGEIVDADVEINGADFSISTAGSSQGTPPCLSDLANTLTHELGHVMGLEHTCLAPDDPPRVDDRGDAVPACIATSDPTILDATMYNYQECGETKKASPEADDVAAVCAIYRLADDPGTCEPIGGGTSGCCDAGAGDRGATGAAALAALTLAGLARRRRLTSPRA